MINVIDIIIRVLALGLIIFGGLVIAQMIKDVNRIKSDVKYIIQKLTDDGQLNNNCDVYCRDCDDKFECSGACIHAVKPEECYKTPERSDDNG